MFAANIQNKRNLRSGAPINNNTMPSQNVPKNAKTVEKVAVVKRSRTALGDVSNGNVLAQDQANGKTKKLPTKARLPLSNLNTKVAEAPEKEVKPITRSRAHKAVVPAADAGKKKKVAIADAEPPVFNAPPKVVKQAAPVATAVVEHATKRAKTEEIEWDDLDAEDFGDPLMVSEYVEEIFEYMKQLEVDTLPNPYYMSLQKDLGWKMRYILADWLIEVHSKFRLLPETLYLTMNIIDRFLSLRVVSVLKLQLVGITAMFIAAKYEEIIAPSIQNFLYVVEGYTEDEIIKAERYVLQVLDFGLQYPNPMSFLRRCSKADRYDNQTRTLAKYLMELSLMDRRFLKMSPSLISAAGLYLGRVMLSRGEWDANLAHFSGYKELELKDCVTLMLEYLCADMVYEALYKKYSAKKFMKAAIFAHDWILKNMESGTAIMGGAIRVGISKCRDDENDDDCE